MFSSFLVNNNNNNDSSRMPVELQDMFLDRHRNIADWIALMKVNQRPGPLFSEPGFSDHLHLRSSDPRATSWSDLDLGATSDLGGPRSGSSKAGKGERYKTELCRSFEETGFCKYKEKCQFAHGFQEVRNVQRHPKYKTDLCRTYHSTGFCPYGSRCHFIHAELTPITTTTTPPSRPPPPLGTSELQVDRKGDGSLSSPDHQGGGISLERLEQYLDTFNRVLQAFSSHPPPPSPPSPSPNNFDVLARQDSVSSGSMRSTPDRLSAAPGADEKWIGYSRYSGTSCSSDNEVFAAGYGGVLQSPRSPTATLFSPNAPEPLSSSSSSSAGLSSSNFWARAATVLHHHHQHRHHHPLTNLFSQTSI